MSAIGNILDDTTEPSLQDAANYGSRTASGNARLFNCKQCNRAFTREEHLTRHTLLTHNKLKPFVCGLCHRPFSRRDLLLRHAKNLHQGSEQAVSRIRKLYKRGSTGSIIEANSLSSVSSNSSDNHGEVGDEVDDPLGPPVGHDILGEDNQNLNSSRSSAVGVKASHDATGGSNQIPRNSGQILDKNYETPEKKRLKMSVNMLVS